MLIFVQSKERAKELFQVLAFDGVPIEAIHADKTQAQVVSIFTASLHIRGVRELARKNPAGPQPDFLLSCFKVGR